MIYGLYLAGGKSSRMGQPKSTLLHSDETPFLDHAYQTLVNNTDGAFISLASRDDTIFYPQICDSEFNTEGMGPLGGLLAAHRSNPDASWVMLACDLPAVLPEDIQTLIQNSDSAEAVAFTNPIDGVAEATATLYHPAALRKLEAYIKNGSNCARHFLEKLDLKTLSPSSPHTLQNLNHPADYEEWKLRAEKEYNTPELELSLEFYAKLGQDAGTTKTTVKTSSVTIAGLWEECRLSYNLSLKQPSVKPAANNSFVPWDYQLRQSDLIAFMPPFAGG